jgi:hypothetical protein
MKTCRYIVKWVKSLQGARCNVSRFIDLLRWLLEIFHLVMSVRAWRVQKRMIFRRLASKNVVSLQVIGFSPVSTRFHLFSRFFTPFLSCKGVDFSPVTEKARFIWKPSHKCPQRRYWDKNQDKTWQANRIENPSKRRIFSPPASLFVGHSPTSGMLPPPALRAAKISRRAICSHL